MSTDWSTATSDEIVKHIEAIRQNFIGGDKSSNMCLWMPSRTYKPLYFKPVFTRVRKGPRKGRRQTLMVKK